MPYDQDDLLHTLSGIRETVKARLGRVPIGIIPIAHAAARGINYGKLYVNLAGETSFFLDGDWDFFIPDKFVLRKS